MGKASLNLLSYFGHLLMLSVSIFQARLYYIQYWSVVGKSYIDH